MLEKHKISDNIRKVLSEKEHKKNVIQKNDLVKIISECGDFFVGDARFIVNFLIALLEVSVDEEFNHNIRGLWALSFTKRKGYTRTMPDGTNEVIEPSRQVVFKPASSIRYPEKTIEE